MIRGMVAETLKKSNGQNSEGLLAPVELNEKLGGDVAQKVKEEAVKFLGATGETQSIQQKEENDSWFRMLQLVARAEWGGVEGQPIEEMKRMVGDELGIEGRLDSYLRSLLEEKQLGRLLKMLGFLETAGLLENLDSSFKKQAGKTLRTAYTEKVASDPALSTRWAAWLRHVGLHIDSDTGGNVYDGEAAAIGINTGFAQVRHGLREAQARLLPLMAKEDDEGKLDELNLNTARAALELARRAVIMKRVLKKKPEDFSDEETKAIAEALEFFKSGEYGAMLKEYAELARLVQSLNQDGMLSIGVVPQPAQELNRRFIMLRRQVARGGETTPLLEYAGHYRRLNEALEEDHADIGLAEPETQAPAISQPSLTEAPPPAEESEAAVAFLAEEEVIKLLMQVLNGQDRSEGAVRALKQVIAKVKQEAENKLQAGDGDRNVPVLVSAMLREGGVWEEILQRFPERASEHMPSRGMVEEYISFAIADELDPTKSGSNMEAKDSLNSWQRATLAKVLRYPRLAGAGLMGVVGALGGVPGLLLNAGLGAWFGWREGGSADGRKMIRSTVVAAAAAGVGLMGGLAGMGVGVVAGIAMGWLKSPWARERLAEYEYIFQARRVALAQVLWSIGQNVKLEENVRRAAQFAAARLFERALQNGGK